MEYYSSITNDEILSFQLAWLDLKTYVWGKMPGTEKQVTV